MSEYQYYEFRAIDRPLDEDQIDELRELSSRAEITATSFTNTYNYGDFRGKPLALMDRYFDAFVYVAPKGNVLTKAKVLMHSETTDALQFGRVRIILNGTAAHNHHTLTKLSDLGGITFHPLDDEGA